MPTTINEGFRQLRRNLEITDLQEETVSGRQQSVRDAVEGDLTVLDTFLTGSYRRSTMVAPLSEADVDIFVVLDPKYYNVLGQKALLNQVKAVLRKTYPQTPDISPNGQAVTITFSDFKVDVVPGFYRTGGGYLIPDANRNVWISTDPKKHVDIWIAANKAHNGNLVPLIKMVKGWNKSRSIFRSFHLEVLILSVLSEVTIPDFPSGVRYLFDKGREKIRYKLPDPSGYSDDVAAYISPGEATEEIIKRMTWAYERAIEAEQFERQGWTESAFGKWRDIFKDYFPAYG